MKDRWEQISRLKASGPSPSFSVVHFIKALELIAEKPIGRHKLSRELALGEGATRTLVARLKDNGLIEIDRMGCFLSKKGRELWDSLHALFPRKVVLGKSGLTLAKFNVAVLVKGSMNSVRLGLNQRDAALMVGAKGATTLVYRDGRLLVPPDYRDVSEDFPEIHENLIISLKPEETDVVVIGSAESLKKAEHGALAAIWTLLSNPSQEPCDRHIFKSRSND